MRKFDFIDTPIKVGKPGNCFRGENDAYAQ